MRAADLPNGVTLTVTPADPRHAAIIRSFGFIGIMATGSRHLAMALGDIHGR
ncbi:hypothetical protein [Roseicella aerolata]|uniref:Uncharacterized protein n=1 Tax=Roseicella aerolata TaxID=2883479 RepID=A0A9X1LCW8_9PROT|nr:hypothetical protein [Roseicella aerolata]